MQKSYNMKPVIFILCCLFSIGVLAQENEEIAEEFIPINIEGKDAFMSTKTGEYTYREHAKTDPTQLKTTASGVVYTDISSHTVKKGETFSIIAKKNGVTVSEIKKHNKVSSSNLKIGSKVKIVKKQLVKSSSPVKGTSGEERIIARLRPGESPGALAPPPPMEEIQKKLVKTEKTREKPLKPKYKAKKDIKNPILGLGDDTEAVEEVAEVEVPKKESKKERLKRLQAEMKALEAELEETEEVKETEVEEAVTLSAVEEPKKEAEKLSVVKEEIEEVEEIAKEEDKEVVEEKESLAKKASRVVSQVKKTNKQVEAKKAIDSETEVEEKEEEESEKPLDKNQAFYTVEKGNSLWGIARMHGMTVDELKKLNNLKNNNLDIGQKLKVKPKK